MCIPFGGLVLPLATTAIQGALSINSSLAQTRALQEQQDEKYKQMVEGIRGRNISLYGKTLRNQDYYKQAAGEALDTATRAYFLEDVKVNRELSKANLEAETNLIKLIRGSGKGAAKGLGGSTAQRIDGDALRKWGRTNARISHGMNMVNSIAEVNKESAQINASKSIKISERKFGVDGTPILEPTPEGPDPIDPWPGVIAAGAQTGLDLFSVISQPSPFNFPGDSGFDASQAYSGNPDIYGNLDWGQNLNLGLGANRFTSMIGGSPYSGY